MLERIRIPEVTEKANWTQNQIDTYRKLDRQHTLTSPPWWNAVSSLYAIGVHRRENPWARAGILVRRLNETEEDRIELDRIKNSYLPEKGSAAALVEMEMIFGNKERQSRGKFYFEKTLS